MRVRCIYILLSIGKSMESVPKWRLEVEGSDREILREYCRPLQVANCIVYTLKEETTLRIRLGSVAAAQKQV